MMTRLLAATAAQGFDVEAATRAYFDTTRTVEAEPISVASYIRHQ